jgi:hypothetical protein
MIRKQRQIYYQAGSHVLRRNSFMDLSGSLCLFCALDRVSAECLPRGEMIGEDFADRGIARLEGKVHNRPLIIAMRLFSNPSRTMANVLRIKWPWRRDDRF